MMIGLLLGFPDEMWPKLMEWSERTITLGGGPRYMEETGMVAAMEFAGACDELYEAKQKCPADDVVSVWSKLAEVGGEPFGVAEVISDCLLLLDGGAETTRTVIARMLVELSRRPDDVAALRAGTDADLVCAVEEMVRYVTPIHNMCRCATVDYEMHGTTIKAGDQVLLMYSSANRDPAHFDDPESLHLTRRPNHHIAFGFGTHFCLGAVARPARDQAVLRRAAPPRRRVDHRRRLSGRDAERVRLRPEVRPDRVLSSTGVV